VRRYHRKQGGPGFGLAREETCNGAASEDDRKRLIDGFASVLGHVAIPA
jgi:hypothetical protein